jgi:hypothetical protein
MFRVGEGSRPMAEWCRGCRDSISLGIVCSRNEAHFDYLLKREATIFQKRTSSEIALGLNERRGAARASTKRRWAAAR